MLLHSYRYFAAPIQQAPAPKQLLALLAPPPLSLGHRPAEIGPLYGASLAPDDASGQAVRLEVGANRSHTSPRAVVHVGPHKTGTTTLQMYLKQNNDRLREVGPRYPSLDQVVREDACTFNTMSGTLVRHVFGGKGVEARMAAMRRALNSSRAARSQKSGMAATQNALPGM